MRIVLRIKNNTNEQKERIRIRIRMIETKKFYVQWSSLPLGFILYTPWWKAGDINGNYFFHAALKATNEKHVENIIFGAYLLPGLTIYDRHIVNIHTIDIMPSDWSPLDGRLGEVTWWMREYWHRNEYTHCEYTALTERISCL